ncbi:MAG: inorganic diphosphatase [Verrucomicrobia bacterium]|nr:inorganic diphosphatase [Verrucomicrobiota bacterium]
MVSAVIETPKGSRNKFDFDPVSGLFYLGGVLPVGAVFPFDFGFIPGTLGDDGDPLDILVLLDDGARSFSGCLVAARLLGAIEAEQTEKDGKSERNDRLIGVAAESRNYHDWQTLDDVPGNLIEEIEHFFKSYNSAKGKKFRPLARVGPARAHKLVKAGKRSARR